MCGRFTLYRPLRDIAQFIGLPERHYGTLGAAYNIAPGRPIVNLSRRMELPAFETYWWGFKPRWAKADFKPAPINARAETVATNGIFRDAFQDSRTVIPADGFYEWRKEGNHKQPYYIRRKDGKPLLFAGIFDHWTAALDDPQYLSCAIITTAANDLMRPIHDRMPVILPARAEEYWLDPGMNAHKLEALLRPAPDDLLEAYPVSAAVNRPANDTPDLIQPVNS